MSHILHTHTLYTHIHTHTYTHIHTHTDIYYPCALGLAWSTSHTPFVNAVIFFWFFLNWHCFSESLQEGNCVYKKHLFCRFKVFMFEQILKQKVHRSKMRWQQQMERQIMMDVISVLFSLGKVPLMSTLKNLWRGWNIKNNGMSQSHKTV